MSIHGLYKVFFPSAVAVLGIDPDSQKPGRRILSNIVRAGFKGMVCPISETVDEVDGLATYPNLAAVKQPVDLAVLSLPLEQVPAAIDACADAGVSGVVIPTRMAGGTTPVSPIVDRARATGVRVIGPRSWGVYNPSIGLNAAFGRQAPAAGELAVISQSASICASILDLSAVKHIGLSLLVGLGDMVEVDAADMLDYTASLSRVKAILLHVEHIAGMRKFMSAARAAARLKPVVALKTGRSQSPGRPAATLSGSLIREDAVYDAAFKRAGIVRVSRVEHLFDCADLLSKQPRPRGPNLAVITSARSPGIMAVDALAGHGLKPAPFRGETLKSVSQILGLSHEPCCPITVPIDMSADRFGRLVEILVTAGEVDALLVILTPQFLHNPDETARAVGAAVVRKTTPVFAVWMGGKDLETGRRILDEAGIPTYDAPERAVNAFLNLHIYDHNIRLLKEIPPRLTGHLAVNRAKARSIIDNALQADRHLIDGEQAFHLLEAYDIPVSPVQTDRPEEQTNGSRIDAEIRLASRQLEPFGPVILFGVGGIPPELCTDTNLAIGLPPLNRLLARHLMEHTRPHRFLRAAAPDSIPLIEKLLVNFSHLVVDFPEIVELEISSLAVKGNQVWTCRARILIQPATRRSPMHLIISPYPDEYEITTTTTSGIPLFIRPIKPEDAPLLQELWSILSPRTLYYRFSTPVTELTPELLLRFTQIDYDREIALVAMEPTTVGGRMLGVSRLLSAPGSDTAEFAIVVGDPWQGCGVGAKLLSRLAAIAVQRGFKTLWGLVLRENRAMIELARKLRWPVIFGADISEVEVRLDLTTVTAHEILAAAGETVSVTEERWVENR